MSIDISPLEALEARRDNLWSLIRAGRATVADCAEYERACRAIQRQLLQPISPSYLDNMRQAVAASESRALRCRRVLAPEREAEQDAHQAFCDQWYDSYAARDYLPESED